MKKILAIVVSCLLFSCTSIAATLSSPELTRVQLTNEWLEKKTVNELMQAGFTGTSHMITATDNHIQYNLYKSFPNQKSTYVVCFVDIMKTTCRLP